jgi:hypothetical protein
VNAAALGYVAFMLRYLSTNGLSSTQARALRQAKAEHKTDKPLAPQDGTNGLIESA